MSKNQVIIRRYDTKDETQLFMKSWVMLLREQSIALLKSDEANKNYKRNYWFSYQDYLDRTDNFTDLSCENLDGKQEYITLIVFSTLPLREIKRIFNEPEDIFPSDIGEQTDFSQNFVVDDNGNLFPGVNLLNNGYSAYYC